MVLDGSRFVARVVGLFPVGCKCISVFNLDSDSLGNSSSRNVVGSIPPMVDAALLIPTPMVAKGVKS
ncbi:hypothetical protein QYF36_005633 [Acer negundo]|nr:hypothetical protein QYF36_005633 [Acer negundo]